MKWLHKTESKKPKRKDRSIRSASVFVNLWEIKQKKFPAWILLQGICDITQSGTAISRCPVEAEKEGFEPSRSVKTYTISSRAPSTKLGDFSIWNCCVNFITLDYYTKDITKCQPLFENIFKCIDILVCGRNMHGHYVGWFLRKN